MLTSGRKRAALVLVAAAMGVSACGSDEGGTIPPGDAQALTDELNDVEDALDRNACDTASAQVDSFRDEVDELGADVGMETKGTLFKMADNLSDLIESDCVEPDPGASGASGPSGAQPSDEDDD